MTHAVFTGPIRGTVTLDNGTTIDVQPDVLYVDDADQAAEIAHKIGVRYQVEGHPMHAFGDPFNYVAPEGKA